MTPTFRGIELPEGRQKMAGLMKHIRKMKREEAEERNGRPAPVPEETPVKVPEQKAKADRKRVNSKRKKKRPAGPSLDDKIQELAAKTNGGRT